LRLMHQRSRGQTGHKKALTAQYLDNPMHDGHKILYTGTS
jgi:hypothetical protein